MEFTPAFDGPPAGHLAGPGERRVSVGAPTSEPQRFPSFGGPADLAEVERVPLSQRGLPASTYELVRRAAEVWPDRTAVSVLSDAEQAARDALAETDLRDKVRAVLVDGAVEVHVPHSSHDDEVGEVLSRYTWTWQLTN